MILDYTYGQHAGEHVMNVGKQTYISLLNIRFPEFPNNQFITCNYMKYVLYP